MTAINSNEKPKTTLRKIPIFIHTPKCAGTYVEGCLTGSLTYYGLQQEWHVKSAELWNLCLRKICVNTKDGKTLFNFLVYDPENECVTCEIFSNKSNNDPYTFYICVEDFLTNMSSTTTMFFFAIVVHSCGVQLLKTNIIELICNQVKVTPLYCTLFRTPFEKARSMYNYLTHNQSAHETTHGLIRSKSFIEFLTSYELADCWFIREYLSLHPNKKIDEESFNLVTTFLDSAIIRDTTHVDEFLNEILIACYDMSYTSIPARFKSNINKNKTEYTVLFEYNDLDESVKTCFKERTLYDQRLYDLYCK